MTHSNELPTIESFAKTLDARISAARSTVIMMRDRIASEPVARAYTTAGFAERMVTESVRHNELATVRESVLQAENRKLDNGRQEAAKLLRRLQEALIQGTLERQGVEWTARRAVARELIELLRDFTGKAAQ